MQPSNKANLTKFQGNHPNNDTLGEIECRRREVLTLADQGVDLGNNQDRICCQTNQPSMCEETREVFGYRKQD